VRATLHVGKLGHQGRLNNVVPGSLVHIVDQLSNRRFLMDTGASDSIFLHSSAAPPSGHKLRGAAGQLIPCWGEKTINLSFQGKPFTWTFLLAAVSFPIIGVDFLRHFGMMVDPAANTLVDKCSAEPDSYPLPNMLDFQERIAGCTIFSKVDLRKGYHQILMHPGDIPKTAIATPFRLFEFLRMTFGLRNAGNTFQRLMDRILAGLDFVFVYLDDVIIGSRSMSEHLQQMRILFQRLQAAGLVINREKCMFGVPEVDFLSHHVSAAVVCRR
jgi:hypothetical protein